MAENDSFLSDVNELFEFCEEFKSIFGDVLKELIASKGFVQKDLSYKLSVHPSAISHFINGSRLPDGPNLYMLVKALALTKAERKKLLAAWHLSSMAKTLVSYIETALEKNDLQLARSIFVELLNTSWSSLFPEGWIQQFLETVDPEYLRKIEIKRERASSQQELIHFLLARAKNDSSLIGLIKT